MPLNRIAALITESARPAGASFYYQRSPAGATNAAGYFRWWDAEDLIPRRIAENVGQLASPPRGHDDWQMELAPTDRDNQAFPITLNTQVYSFEIIDPNTEIVAVSGRFRATSSSRGSRVGGVRYNRYAVDASGTLGDVTLGFTVNNAFAASQAVAGYTFNLWPGVATESRSDFWIEVIGTDQVRIPLGVNQAAFINPYLLLRARYQEGIGRGSIIEFEGVRYSVALAQSTDRRHMELALTSVSQA